MWRASRTQEAIGTPCCRGYGSVVVLAGRDINILAFMDKTVYFDEGSRKEILDSDF